MAPNVESADPDPNLESADPDPNLESADPDRRPVPAVRYTNLFNFAERTLYFSFNKFQKIENYFILPLQKKLDQ
jgi:hypothetical protein